MAAVGVHVELTVRFLTIGKPWKHTTIEVEVRAGHRGCLVLVPRFLRVWQAHQLGGSTQTGGEGSKGLRQYSGR